MTQSNVWGSRAKIVPLSFTRIPFDGTCWMSRQEIQQARKAVSRLFLVSTQPNAFDQLLVRTKGLPFDVLPLRYLDWLAGQPWLYGEFKDRLERYLKKPCIQRELDSLFPDESACIQGGQGDVWCSTEERVHHTWHGQPMPEEFIPISDDPPPMKPYTAWKVAADFLSFLDTHDDPHDLLDIDFHELAQACRLLPAGPVQHLRHAYKSWRQQVRKARFQSANASVLWNPEPNANPHDFSSTTRFRFPALK
jgi:hypothetical protein